MKKTVGKQTVSRTTPSKTNSFKASPSKALRSNTKKPATPKRHRTVRAYSGPTDYDSYLESNALGAGEAELPAGADRAAESGQGASLLSMFGGIDGVITMMTKANQVFKLFQQMGPMFKMISSFAGAKATTASLKPGKARAGQRHRKTRR